MRGECQGSIPALAGEPPWTVSPTPLRTVYPRACGGTNIPLPKSASLDGLSPRLRGNPALPLHRQTHLGSIPALAGEPYSVGKHIPAGRVYPRACGGTPLRSSQIADSRGLSPRLRGNRSVSDYHDVPLGSIPALAGEPGFRHRVQLMPKVYPRACGGTYSGDYEVMASAGLSPRLRGNQQTGAHVKFLSRSIPALAGEPYPCYGNIGAIRVYPRACGGTRRWA